MALQLFLQVLTDMATDISRFEEMFTERAQKLQGVLRGLMALKRTHTEVYKIFTKRRKYQECMAVRVSHCWGASNAEIQIEHYLPYLAECSYSHIETHLLMCMCCTVELQALEDCFTLPG